MVTARRLGFEDALTGLPNRSLFLDRLGQALAAAQHEGVPLALCVLDLDGFKDLNEALGHAAGDGVLCEVAARLRGTLREHETVARLGPDEFAVLLPAHQSTAELVAARLTRALSAPFDVAGQKLGITASMGIATYPDHGETAETLLRRADTALHHARRTRTGFAIAAIEYGMLSGERFVLIGGLRRLLAGASDVGQLQLRYQPKVDCQSGAPLGAEALVHWLHPSLGVVPPTRFVHLAEQAGLIKALTRWALDTSLSQCRHWLASGWHVGVAVNLSAHDIQDDTLSDFIDDLLASHGVPAELLTVEITEGILVEDPAQAMTVLHRLDAVGVRASLDDFGTGYSSLAYLKHLPVHELKIDQSFVRDLVRDQRDRAIVSSTIGLGHSLGMRVVAEGVEDQATLDCLRNLGADVVQGYHVGLPQAAAAFDEWLAARFA